MTRGKQSLSLLKKYIIVIIKNIKKIPNGFKVILGCVLLVRFRIVVMEVTMWVQ